MAETSRDPIRLEPAHPVEPIICFSSGTRILTPSGERRIETLGAGDLVVTLDNGPLPIKWIGSTTIRASGAYAPIRVAKGTIGNTSDLRVSPDHRLLINLDGPEEQLVPAKSLVDNYRITIDYGGIVTYHHMLFDTPQIVLSTGAASESFQPSDDVLTVLTPDTRDALFRAAPSLRSNAGSYGRTTRRISKVVDF